MADLDPTRVQGLGARLGEPNRTQRDPGPLACDPSDGRGRRRRAGDPARLDVALDGTTGELYVNPDEDTLHQLEALDERARAVATLAMEAAHAPAITADGVEILVGANIGSVADAQAAAAHGADLAGLVRTEFLYLDRREAPTVEQQVEVYRALAAALAGRRLTLRTLDVGGDKPLPYAPQPPENNPFLGYAGNPARARPAGPAATTSCGRSSTWRTRPR